ncbi:hypothetical protein ACLOJK_012621 [Asimina triloba]
MIDGATLGVARWQSLRRARRRRKMCRSFRRTWMRSMRITIAPNSIRSGRLLSLLAAAGAQGIDRNEAYAYAEVQTGACVVVEARKVVEALVVSLLRVVLSGSELVSESHTKVEVECVFGMREVLNPRFEYDQTSIEGRRIVKEPLESFDMDTKARTILVKFIPGWSDGILNLTTKGLEVRRATDTLKCLRMGTYLKGTSCRFFESEFEDPYGGDKVIVRDERWSVTTAGKRPEL